MMLKLKYKYNLSRDTRGFLTTSINNHIVWFATKVLDTKLVQKMWSKKCTVGMNAAVELYIERVQMNWSHYLLNEFL